MIHVLTPFSRSHLLPVLLPMLEREHIAWHPILHEPVEFHQDWIFPMMVTLRNGMDPCYDKLNRWIKDNPIVDDDLYGFLCDDDAYEPGTCARIRDVAVRDVLVISMDRSREGRRRLIAQPRNMRPRRVGLGQYFVTGRVLQHMRFLNTGRADGCMAEWLALTWKCDYRPELTIYRNRLMQS